MFDPTKMPRGAMRSATKLGTFLGFAGGFLFAYQNSSRECGGRAEGRQHGNNLLLEWWSLWLKLTRMSNSLLFPPILFYIPPSPPTPLPRPLPHRLPHLSYLPHPTPVRLWGFRENSREVARAKEEGQSALGLDTSKSSLDPYMQGVAHRNSAYSQFKLAVMPWFNVVNHAHHGPGVGGEE